MSTIDDGWDYCRLTIRPHFAERSEEDELRVLLTLIDDLEHLAAKGWHLTRIDTPRPDIGTAFEVVLKRERVVQTLPMHGGAGKALPTRPPRLRRAA